MRLKNNPSRAIISLTSDFTAINLICCRAEDGETDVCFISYRDGQNLGNRGGSKWPEKNCMPSVYILSLFALRPK